MTKQRADGGARAAGLITGAVLDRAVPDPRRGHPVALFGAAAARLERALYRPSRASGALFTAAAVGSAAALGALAERASGPGARAAATAAGTWAVSGGAMLRREAGRIADALEAGDLDEARRRLPGLCGRDPSALDGKGIARAAVESVAENTSDAAVGGHVWGALLGLPGLLGHRAANTLDAMVGHRSERYQRFGSASARLDDVAGWAPARLTALLACAAAPLVGGDARRALAVTARYGHRHPSPNAGHCEAAFAGALDLRLGGANRYGDRVEHRPELGDGRPPGPADLRRAIRLAGIVDAASAGLAALAAAGIPERAPGAHRGRGRR
ncbi:cobalamin biosynthesis protein [Nocardiopsis potens]|uniref:cobalamin biosynthesis protein n=1 Tax=Nocardiopsis potens TaxID=1246458 RepID=UPI00034759C1|nr:cobalamin biosynthesis protein [Nocardiopsis potens]